METMKVSPSYGECAWVIEKDRQNINLPIYTTVLSPSHVLLKVLPTNGCLDLYLSVINEVKIQWHLRRYSVRLLALYQIAPHQNSGSSNSQAAI